MQNNADKQYIARELELSAHDHAEEPDSALLDAKILTNLVLMALNVTSTFTIVNT